MKKLLAMLTGAEARERSRTRLARTSVPPTAAPPVGKEDIEARTGEAVIFLEAVKHGGVTLPVGIPVAFSDRNARDYFVGSGWAEPTDEPPVQVFPKRMVEIDTKAVVAGTGKRVLEG